MAILLSLLLLFVHQGDAQRQSTPGLALGYNYPTGARRVLSTDNGGYLFIGYATIPVHGTTMMETIKLDPVENVEWECSEYGNDYGKANLTASDGVKGKDGGYLIAGSIILTGQSDSDVALLKIKDNGSWAWSRVVGKKDRTETGRAVTQGLSGGYLVAGDCADGQGVHMDAYFLMVDEVGNTIWEKTAGGSGDDGICALITVDDGYVAAGTTDSRGAGSRDMYVIKLGANGDILWEKTLGGGWDDMAFALCGTKDKGFLVAGSTASSGAGGEDCLVVKLDRTGSREWQAVFGGPLNERALSVCEIPDGGYLAAGYAESKGAGKKDAYLVRLTEKGETALEKTFGGNGDDIAYSLARTQDRFIVAGSSTSFDAAQEAIYALKVDADGMDRMNIASVSFDSAPYQYAWTRIIPTGGMKYSGTDVFFDSKNNIYLEGIFQGNVNFASDWKSKDQKISHGNADIFVTKMQEDGSYGWTKAIGGPLNDWPNSLSFDAKGNMYFLGRFRDSVDFAEAWGKKDVKKAGAGEYEFLTKVNAAGAYEWTRKFKGIESGSISNVTVAADGGISLAYRSTDGNEVVNIAEDWGKRDFIDFGKSRDVYAKVDVTAGGGYLRSELVGGLPIATDTSGNSLYAGDVAGSQDLFRKLKIRAAPASGERTAYYVMKVKKDGVVDWIRTFNASDAAGVVTFHEAGFDGSGAFYFCGTFTGGIDFSSGWGTHDMKGSAGRNTQFSYAGRSVDQDIFVMKILGDGSYGWTRRIGGVNRSYGDRPVLLSVTADGAVNLFCALEGELNISADWGMTDFHAITGPGNYGVFIIAMDPAGSYRGAKQLEGPQIYDWTRARADGYGNFYIFGPAAAADAFSGPVDYALGWGSADVRMVSDPTAVFLTKIELRKY